MPLAFRFGQGHLRRRHRLTATGPERWGLVFGEVLAPIHGCCHGAASSFQGFAATSTSLRSFGRE
jgi:hypothetical protein